MSREEEINIAYLLKKMDEKQDAHIAASNVFREDMITKIGKIETHASYTQEKVKNNTDDIDSLKATRLKQNGAIITLSVIWTAILAFLGLSK